MDRGRSRSSRKEDEARQASKQLKTGHQGQEKEVTTQSEPKAWLPAPMLHGEPLMDNTSLRDYREGEGTFVANALERSLLIPPDMAELGGLRRQEVFLSIKRYLGMVRLLTLVASLIFVLWFPTHHVLVSIGRLFRYRLEEETNDQGRALKLERDNRLDAMWTLKNFEADLLKARENLKEMTRARDSAELGLVSAQKQAEDQTRRLLKAKDQFKIANEQITNLKKKLAKAEGAKNIAEWARDEALRAKEAAVFARVEAESLKEKAEEEAYDLGMAETQATLKA